jgi:hypothetical protein
MSLYSVQEMYCTVCGRKYPWTCNYSWPTSRACSRECHEEWCWKEILSNFGKQYYPKPSEEKKSVG